MRSGRGRDPSGVVVPVSGSRANVRLGWWAERVVLNDRLDRARRRGWGFAVPLAPAYPADVLDLQPNGPVFVEVKATRQRRFPALSPSEIAFAEECRQMGAGYIVAVVRPEARGWPPPRYSLSYSPVPRVGPRTGRRPRRLPAQVVPPLAEPTTYLGRAPGTASDSEGTGGGTTAVAMTSGRSQAPPSGAAAQHGQHGSQYAEGQPTSQPHQHPLAEDSEVV